MIAYRLIGELGQRESIPGQERYFDLPDVRGTLAVEDDTHVVYAKNKSEGKVLET